jgi:hypothetical protein
VYQTDIAITHDLLNLLDDFSWIFVLPEPQEFDMPDGPPLSPGAESG